MKTLEELAERIKANHLVGVNLHCVGGEWTCNTRKSYDTSGWTISRGKTIEEAINKSIDLASKKIVLPI